MNRLAPHPWKVHSRSRYFSWPRHPLRGVPGDPAQADHVAGPILEHRLDPPGIGQAPDGLGVDGRASLDLAAVQLVSWTVPPGVDNDTPVRLGVLPNPPRA